MSCSGASGLHKLHRKHLRMQSEWTPSASPYSSIHLCSKSTRPTLRSHQERAVFCSPSPIFRECTWQPARFSRSAKEVCAFATAEETTVKTGPLVGSSQKKPVVKVCGVTSPEDAAMAAKAGADFIGMIMSPGSEISVMVESLAVHQSRVQSEQPVAKINWQGENIRMGAVVVPNSFTPPKSVLCASIVPVFKWCRKLWRG